MKISRNWLSKFIDLSDINIDTLSHTLTMAGLEVEDVVSEAKLYEHFVIAFVEEKIKHPNANKLSLCKVFNGKETLNIVCGAPNVDAGQKIVLAQVGAIVPDGGFEIKAAKIRGEESFGMICSQKELGLSDDHSGIWVLPADAPVGTPLAEYLGKTDDILEIGITPNRPDALSHIGVARDVAALFNRPVTVPQPKMNDRDANDIKKHISISIEDTFNCPRYSAKVVKGVTIGESPAWVKKALESIGLRSINNVVDITNYLLHETGQPLHAFDLALLEDKKIIVKAAQNGQEFTTLDSKKRVLDDKCLMICDGRKPVALAGVMGGENSEVTLTTKDVLIESAYFRPGSVRKTAKKFTLSTDASYRFERGVDYENTLLVAERAAEMIAEIAGGEIVPGAIDVYPQKIERVEAVLRYARVEKILGYPVAKDAVNNILEKLGIEIVSADDTAVTTRIPGFRPDIEREIDLIEEIARIYGYDNIPPIQAMTLPLTEVFDETAILDELRNYWTGIGFNEVISNSLLRTKIEEEKPKAIATLNPQSADMADLRTSLLPGLLGTIARNIAVGEKTLRIYEIGDTFIKKNDPILSFADFEEKEMLGVAITGLANRKEWYAAEKRFDFFSLKGLAEAFLQKISLDNLANDSYNHSGNYLFDYSIEKKSGSAVLLQGGKVRKEVLQKYDIDQDVYYLEFDVAAIRSAGKKGRKFTELLKFPKVTRDAAFVVEKTVQAAAIETFIKTLPLQCLKELRLFDLFEHSSLGEGKKSLAWSMVFWQESRTLTDEEVDNEFKTIIDKVIAEFHAELRR
jgi:phenylalanyl-tRNA synthetase beta chain